MEHVLGVVLAGGRSRRMGTEKALVPFGGRPLAAWPIAALQAAGLPAVVVAKRELPELDVPTWIEPAQPTHPLLGIITALDRHQGPIVAVACDMPFLDAKAIRALATARGSVACAKDQPLASRWEPELLPELRQAVAASESMRALVARLQAIEVPLDAEVLRNLNRPEDLEALQPPTPPPPSSRSEPPPSSGR